MSRLSGFTIRKNEEVVFSISWKNYFDIDTFIWKNSKFNQQCGEQSHDDCNELRFYENYESFEEIVNYLLDKYSSILFDDEDSLPVPVDDALTEWQDIIHRLNHFIQWHTDEYKTHCTYEFFSCF